MKRLLNAIPWGWITLVFLQLAALGWAHRCGRQDGFREDFEATKTAIFGAIERINREPHP